MSVIPTTVTITPATISRMTGTNDDPPPDDPPSFELAGTMAVVSVFVCFLSAGLFFFAADGVEVGAVEVGVGVVVDPEESD